MYQLKAEARTSLKLHLVRKPKENIEVKWLDGERGAQRQLASAIYKWNNRNQQSWQIHYEAATWKTARFEYIQQTQGRFGYFWVAIAGFKPLAVKNDGHQQRYALD